MLIAEELLLLGLDDASGRKLVGSDRLDPALGGALVAELALRERVGVTGDAEGWSRRRRITVTSLVPTDDPELDAALRVIAENEGRKVKDLLSTSSSHRLTKGLRVRLLERLAAAGAVDRNDQRMLGLIPRTTWPVRDRTAEDEVRRRLHGALVAGPTPSESTVALVALLRVTGLLTAAVPVEDKRALRARAEQLSEGDWVARAVKAAVEEAQAAASGWVS